MAYFRQRFLMKRVFETPTKKKLFFKILRAWLCKTFPGKLRSPPKILQFFSFERGITLTTSPACLTAFEVVGDL
jgi:hypothetical protein